MKLILKNSPQRSWQLTNLSLAARCTILSSDLQQAVSVNLESGDQLGLSTGHGRDSVELELAKQAVVAALCALTLVADRVGGGIRMAVNLYAAGTYTGKVTVVWLSSTVVKTRDLLVGIGVLRGTTTPKMSPCMATPRERGATSSKRRSAVLSEVWPVRTAAWTAAP